MRISKAGALVMAAGGLAWAAPAGAVTVLDFSSTGQSSFPPGAVLGSTFVVPTYDVNESGRVAFADTEPSELRAEFDRIVDERYRAELDARRCTDTFLGRVCAPIETIAQSVRTRIYNEVVDEVEQRYGGTTPPANVPVAASVDYDVTFRSALEGSVGLTGGTLETRISGTAETEVVARNDGTGIVTLRSTASDLSTATRSEFPDVELSVDLVSELAAGFEVSATSQGFTGSDSDTVTRSDRRNLFNLKLGEEGVPVVIDGEPVPVLADPVEVLGLEITGPEVALGKTIYRGLNTETGPATFAVVIGAVPPVEAGIPLASIQAKYPTADGAASSSGLSPALIEVGPPDRTGEMGPDFLPDQLDLETADFVRLEADIDGNFSPVPLGLGGAVSPKGIPLFSAEANVVDADLASYFSVAQNIAVTPGLTVTYRFSEPVFVETGPGTLSDVAVLEVTLPVGSDLSFLHPGTDGFSVTPVYGADATTFASQTQILADSALEGEFLQIVASGLLGDVFTALTGLGPDAALFRVSQSLGDPSVLFSGGSLEDAFPLLGFASIEGERLLIAATSGPSTPVPVPLPAGGLLLLGALGLLGAGRLGVRG